MPLQGPADAAAAESIQDHRQVDKLVRELDVRDIGHPQLIEARQHHLGSEIRVDGQRMARIRRADKAPLAQAQQVIRSHQPQHQFMVRHDTTTCQLVRNAAIAITGPFERDALDLIAKPHVYVFGLRATDETVIGPPGHRYQIAHACNRESAR